MDVDVKIICKVCGTYVFWGSNDLSNHIKIINRAFMAFGIALILGAQGNKILFKVCGSYRFLGRHTSWHPGQ